MGGDRGCCAAVSNFSLAAAMASADEEGEMRKKRVPKMSIAPRTMVMGFVRRNARIAMM